MDEIGKILPAAFKREVQRGDARLIEILAPVWPRVAGKPIARQCRPVAFGAGTLTLATACSTWAGQLRLMAEEIRAEINSYLGRPVVKNLRIELVQKLESPEAHGRPQAVPPALEPTPSPWPGGEAKLDPETAQILKRSFSKYFARKKDRVH